MPVLDEDFNIRINIPDDQLAAYEKAMREGDLAALKRVLLCACSADQARAIETFLPAELVQTN